MADFSSDSDVKNFFPAPIDIEHPEILSLSHLKQILIQHNVPEEYCSGANKEKLLELYRKTVLPLPQREFYRQNRRGQFLSHSKQMHAKQKSQKCCTMTQSPQKNPNLDIAKSVECHSRLKPPPSIIKFDSKKITSAQSNDSESVFSKNEPNHSKLVTSSKRKIISLINDTLTSNTSVETNGRSETASSCKKNSTNNLEETVPLTKKHKPITWP